MTENKPNQHDGPCWKCGTTVPAGTGTYNRDEHRSEHPEGACKTHTKTWRRYRLRAEAIKAAQQPVPEPIIMQYRRAEIRNFLKARFGSLVTPEMVENFIEAEDAEHNLEGRVS